MSNLPLATAIAGGAVISALLDALVKKGVLTGTEIQKVLSEAQGALVSSPDLDVAEAARIVSGWYQQFAHR
jgi:hypothetical protein